MVPDTLSYAATNSLELCIQENNGRNPTAVCYCMLHAAYVLNIRGVIIKVPGLVLCFKKIYWLVFKVLSSLRCFLCNDTGELSPSPLHCVNPRVGVVPSLWLEHALTRCSQITAQYLCIQGKNVSTSSEVPGPSRQQVC